MNKIQPIIDELRSLERDYQANTDIQQQLGEKSLVLLVAPAAAGKSTLMNNLVASDDRFSRISGFTTREARPDDEAELYRYIQPDVASLKGILDQVRARELVQYAVHPTTGKIYGTELSDYPNEYNCKDVLGHAVQGFRSLSARSTYSFGLVCKPQQWINRLLDRYDSADPELKKRLAEARFNIEWSRDDSRTVLVENSNGDLDRASQEIIGRVTGTHTTTRNHQPRLNALAEAMLLESDRFYSTAA